MNFLVCISKTPDTTAKIAFSADLKSFNSSGVQYILNPYDEWYALVRALELKEQIGGNVTVLNVGPVDNDQIIRKALAIGADDAVRIDCEPLSAMQVAFQIAQYAKTKQFDIIFTGKETIDYNGSEVGSMLAELLDLPFVSYASKLDLSGNTATIERDIEGGTEVVAVDVPFAVSAAKGMAEQRIPNMRGIMMAKSKALEVVSPVAFSDLSLVASYNLPKEKSAVKMVNPDDMQELVRLLHEEAKAI